MTEWLKDTVERVVSTFLETFIAVWLITLPTDWNISTAKNAALSGIAAALAVLKAALASRKSNTVSPASLAPSSTPAA